MAGFYMHLQTLRLCQECFEFKKKLYLISTLDPKMCSTKLQEDDEETERKPETRY